MGDVGGHKKFLKNGVGVRTAGLPVARTVPYGMTGSGASLGALDCGTGRSGRPRRGGRVPVKVRSRTIHSHTRGGGRGVPQHGRARPGFSRGFVIPQGSQCAAPAGPAMGRLRTGTRLGFRMARLSKKEISAKPCLFGRDLCG